MGEVERPGPSDDLEVRRAAVLGRGAPEKPDIGFERAREDVPLDREQEQRDAILGKHRVSDRDRDGQGEQQRKDRDRDRER